MSAKLMAFKAEQAAAREIAATRQKAFEDVSAEDVLSLALKRELRRAEIEGVGSIYYYHPQSVAERDAYQRHIRYDGETARVSMRGIVDGIIARARTRGGTQMFNADHAERLLAMPADTLLGIWHSFGDEVASSIESAEKK